MRPAPPRLIIAALTAAFLVAPVSAYASTDSAIRARWTPRLEARKDLLAVAQARHHYWAAEHRKARAAPMTRRWYARNMHAARRRDVRHRRRQVAYAQRVIDRHTPRPAVGAVGTGGWAIPAAIVMCESGGSYTARNPSGARGAYQLMPGTYAAYGGDGSWTPADQDRVAARLYAAEGTAPWNASRACWGGRV